MRLTNRLPDKNQNGRTFTRVSNARLKIWSATYDSWTRRTKDYSRPRSSKGISVALLRQVALTKKLPNALRKESSSARLFGKPWETCREVRRESSTLERWWICFQWGP